MKYVASVISTTKGRGANKKIKMVFDNAECFIVDQNICVRSFYAERKDYSLITQTENENIISL